MRSRSRRADRHVAINLKNASDASFDLITRKGLIDNVEDKDVQNGLAAARKRLAAEKTSAYDRLRLIVYGEDTDDRSAEVTDIITTMDIDRRQEAGVQFIYEARKRCARGS